MKRLLDLMFSGLVKHGSLKVELPNGESRSFGDGNGIPVVVRFATWGALFSLAADPQKNLGEIFMDGGLVLERGSIYDFLEVLLRDSGGKVELVWAKALDLLRKGTRGFVQRNFGIRSRNNVAHHYDLDARLYRLFLDSDRQYSCAYFEREDMTLEEAQLAKKRHIASKLCLQPGNRILDIGCGWGGMGLYLAQAGHAGAVTGITLSQEQLAVARRRAEEAGLADRVTFRLEDYRETKETFDRIVSVGMFEHVGVNYYDAYFQAARRLLAPDGVMLMHTIGNAEVPTFTNPWIQKYIFPGGYIPAMSEVLPAIERAGLVVTDVEVWRLHYAKTLRAWRERFLARRDEAKALYDERFCRMWEFYLAASETAFRYQNTVVFQFQLAPKQENVPLTRDYIAVAKARLQEAERDLPPA